MEEPSRSVPLPIVLVFWFLVAAAVGWGFIAVRHAFLQLTQKRMTARVMERTVALEVRELMARRSSRKIPRLFAVTPVALVREDTKEVVRQTEERIISTDQLATHEFLDHLRPGTTVQGAERRDNPKYLDLVPPATWTSVVAPFAGLWMFGCFAWLAKPDELGRLGEGVAFKMLVFAGVPAVVGALAAAQHHLGERARRPAERAPVQGYSRTMTVEELLSELAGLGVKADNKVRAHLGDGDIRFCEYEWEGRKWRSASLWCQPPEGTPCEGTVDPTNPRDVKWAGEP